MALILQITTFAEGQAIVAIGLLALLLWGIISFKNPSAGILWGVTVIFFIFVQFLGTPIELFYLGLLFTTAVLVIGLAVRWSVS
jgi:hypothetical protein